MFVQPFAYAFLLAAGVAAQESSSSVEGFMTIQTSAPSAVESLSSVVSSVVSSVASPVVSSVVSPVVSAPASISSILSTQTDGPLLNPTNPTETIPQLTFCNGVYTNTPCSSATGMMSIPQGETPLPSSVNPAPSSAGASAPNSKPSGSADERSSSGRITPTSSVSNSVPSATQSKVNTPGAAASLLKGDSLIWAAALSGLSATLGFAFTLL